MDGPPLGAACSQRCAARGQLELDQCAALGRSPRDGGRIDDHACRLSGVGFAEQLLPGGEGLIGVHDEGAALGGAAVLAARHHLLSGVATLLEVHPSDLLVVDHLRHELVDRGLLHTWDAAHHVQPLPLLCGQCGQLAEARLRGCSVTHPQPAGHAQHVGQARQLAPRQRLDGPGGRVHGSAEGRPGRGTHDAQHRHGLRGIRQLGFGAQHEHGQALDQGGHGVPIRNQPQQVRLRTQVQQAAQHPALGRTIGGQAGLVGRMAVDVLAELAVQKGGSLVALGLNDAQIGHQQGAGPGSWVGKMDLAHRLIIITVAMKHSTALPYPPRFVRQHGGVLTRLLTLLVMLTALAAAAGWWWVSQPLPLNAPTAEFSVEAGSSPREVARGWSEAGVQTSPEVLYQWFRWSGQSRQIRAGSYEIQQGASARDLLRMMVQGDESLARVKLIEGWTFQRWREELAKADGLQPTTRDWTPQQIMAELGQPGVAAEGRFFPDTYAYAKGNTDLAVMRRAQHAMQKHLDAAWAQRDSQTPLKSADEALILASIVEKETGQDADRALMAAVRPAQTQALYFVARGDGSSAFSATLDEHNRAVNQYQRTPRKNP